MTDDPRLARRAFLARSALASGALVIGAPGCGASLPSMRGGESDELLSRLDRGLDRVRSVPRGEFARHMTWLPQPEISEVILRKTLETLVIADVARSLPEDVAVRGASRRRSAPSSPCSRRRCRPTTRCSRGCPATRGAS